MKPQPAPAPILERARKLPTPAPGKVVIVPLELLPAYLALHQREPAKWADGVLIVKRAEAK